MLCREYPRIVPLLYATNYHGRDASVNCLSSCILSFAGGFDGRSRVSDFHGFNVNTQTWNEVQHIAGDPPSPRHSHAAVVYNDSMFVFGGYDGSYRCVFLSS